LKNNLLNLVQLQLVDSALFAIEKEKGDLPNRVNSSKQKLDAAEDDLRLICEQLIEQKTQKARLELEIKTCMSKKNEYEEKLYAVTSNKEYDAVTLEIEAITARIDESETDLINCIDDEEKTGSRQEELEKLVVECKTEYGQVTKALKKSIESNAEKEKKLLSDRSGFEDALTVQVKRTYDRIRKGKSAGLAVVPVERDSCGGCFNQIPPQKVMEVRDGDKLISCEYCGRILYSKETMAAAAIN